MSGHHEWKASRSSLDKILFRKIGQLSVFGFVSERRGASFDPPGVRRTL